MSIFDKQQDLENVPDQALIQLGQQPDPQYPSYLVMAEVERRRDMRQRHEAEMAKHQAANPPDIATQRMDELGGIAGVDPAMGQGPPPEDMAALQGGIAGGPPPGMEQMGGPPPDMGGPPPGMEGQPPMMAYGGLIPGYEHGGAYPDPDEDGFLRRLWSERGQPYLEESMENIRDFPSRTIFTEEGRRPDPEMDWETRDVEGGPGAMEAFSPAAIVGKGKGILQLGKAAWPRVRQAAGTARTTVGRHLPGQAIRGLRQASTVADDAWKVADDFAKAAEDAAKASRAALDALLKGKGKNFVALKGSPADVALKQAKKHEKVARLARGKATDAKGLWDDAQGLVDTAIADRGLTSKLASGIASRLWRNKKKAGLGYLGWARWRGGEDPNRAAGGLIPGYQDGGLHPDPDEDDIGSDRGWLLDQLYGIGRGMKRDIATIPRVADVALPEGLDLPDPVEKWAYETEEELSPAGARRRAREERAELLDSMAQVDDPAADPAAVALAEAERLRLAREEARRIRDEDRAYRRRWVDEAQGATDIFRGRMQDPSDEQLERRELWATEADRETDLLARELGLSTERVDELRREMRTEKETDHARKARLFSGLGAALMGSPRNLGESLKGTTTGLEDLDEELRVERRRDLGDVYTQRARSLSAERSGRTGIRSLREKRFADIIAQQTAGEAPAYQGMMDIYGRAMSTDAQLEAQRLALQKGLEQARMQMGQFNPADWPHMEAIIADLLRQTSPSGEYPDPVEHAKLQRQVGQLPQVLMSATLRPLLGGLPQVIDRVDVPVGVYPDNQ